MKKAFLLAGLIMAVGLCACSKKPAAEEVVAPVAQAPDAQEGEMKADDAAKAEANKETCKITTDVAIDEAAWADANNAFGLAMLKASQGSSVVSPYSVERAVGMVLEGACGTTASEIRTAMSLPEANNLSDAGGKVEKSMLAEFAEGVTVNVDNRVWVDGSYKLLDDYTARVKAAYRAEPTTLDFVNASDAALKTINDAVAKATNDKIQNILPAGSVNGMTRLVLTNAIYFKAPWQHSFNAELTKKADFKTADGVIQVDMMRHKKEHRVHEAETYTALDMGFAGSSYSLMIVLPKLAEGANVDEALTAVENSFTAASLREMREKMQNVDVELEMPKFRVEAGTPLKSMLSNLGMKAAFGNDADFSGISGKDDLYIAEVFHKAYIDVDENGAEAAAATAIPMMMKALHRPANSIKLTVDHPFMFAIMENNSGAALFVGRVNKI